MKAIDVSTLGRLVELLVAEPRPEVQACLLEAVLVSALRTELELPEAAAPEGATRRSITDRSVTDRSVTDRSVTDRGVTDRSVTDRSVTDRSVERALARMRDDLSRHWTVRELAEQVGLSRAAFARRFVEAMGEPPQRWLIRTRLEHAAALLVEADDALAGVAAAVGYESEFAFSRAFRRQFGVAPGAYRRRLRSAGGGSRFGSGSPIRLAA